MILILSPHTDDIELGCGGSLIKWKEEGKKLHVVVFSTCRESLLDGWDKDITEREFKTNMEKLKSSYEILNYPVRRFSEHRQDILEVLIKLRELKPELVLIPSKDDIHQDHKVLAEEGIRAFQGRVLSYELHNIGFKPNYYVELSRRNVTKKLGLMHTYKSQVFKGKKYLSDEYVYGLSRVRGAEINKDYAEGFEVIRWIE